MEASREYKALVAALATMAAKQVRQDADESEIAPLSIDEFDEYVGYWMDQLKQDVREQIR